MRTYLKTLFISLVLSFIGGFIFYHLHIPLAWILGPITILLIYKTIFKTHTEKSSFLRNIAFVMLGIQIGSTFTTNTFEIVTPYFFPFLLLTILTIVVAMGSGYLLSKLTSLDKLTSVLGAVPGGLSVMIAMSESYKSNTIFVTLFHSIRLLAVLFIVPFIVTQFFIGDDGNNSNTFLLEGQSGPLWTIGIYLIFYFVARFLSEKVPASYVIVPMLCTALLNSTGFALFHLPVFCYVAAQLILGLDLGYSVSVENIKKSAKYCLYYFILNIGVILFTFLIGFLFTLFTPMNLVTAILSFAPGGLVEMAITAQEVGGDPAIVGSLQMIRLLIIVLFLPFLLKWVMNKFQNKETYVEKTLKG